MNSKLNTLSKALNKCNSTQESFEVTKLASVGLFLLGALEGVFQWKSEEILDFAGLPAAKEGFNYELYFRANRQDYKSGIDSFGLKAVIGDVYSLTKKSDKPTHKNMQDVINSEPVKSAQRITATGYNPPEGFFFVPRYGIAYINWKDGSSWKEVIAEPAKGKTPSNIFSMYITDESIASTSKVLSFNDGTGEIGELSEVKEDDALVAKKNLALGLVGAGGSAMAAAGTAGSTWGGLSAASGAYGAWSAGTAATLGGGTLATGTGAVVGSGAAALSATGVGLAVLGAGFAGWQIGTAIDKSMGLSQKIPSAILWMESAMAEDGNDYELTLQAGRWEPFIKEFKLELVSGPLIKNKVKVSEEQNDTAGGEFVPPNQKSEASGKKFGEDTVLMPTKVGAMVNMKDGQSFMVPGSTVKFGDPIQVFITESDLTAKISRLVSKGKFKPSEGMPLSGSDVKAAVSSKAQESAAAKAVASGKPPSASVVSAPAGAVSPAKSTSGGATTWDQYMVKTPNGQPVRDAWNKWATTLGYNPDDYLSFKTLWKTFAKKAGTYQIGVSQTASMLEALGRATAIDQKNPATKGAFTSQAWNLISKLDLARLADINEYNKSYVA